MKYKYFATVLFFRYLYYFFTFTLNILTQMSELATPYIYKTGPSLLLTGIIHYFHFVPPHTAFPKSQDWFQPISARQAQLI